MRPERKDEIRALRLFRELTPESFERLLTGSYFQRFPERVALIREGEPADFLHIVTDGAVELYSSWNNRECTMAIAQPVSTFILAAVLKDAPYLMSGRTIESSEILMIPAANIRRTMETDSGFALAMVTELADRYRGVIKATKNLKLRNAVERLANYLLHQHAAQGATGSISLPIAKSVLASLLGMTPENLSRSFATLRAYGVTVDGASIALSKLRDLERLARPSPFIDDPNR